MPDLLDTYMSDMETEQRDLQNWNDIAILRKEVGETNRILKQLHDLVRSEDANESNIASANQILAALSRLWHEDGSVGSPHTRALLQEQADAAREQRRLNLKKLAQTWVWDTEARRLASPSPGKSWTKRKRSPPSSVAAHWPWLSKGPLYSQRSRSWQV